MSKQENVIGILAHAKLKTRCMWIRYNLQYSLYPLTSIETFYQYAGSEIPSRSSFKVNVYKFMFINLIDGWMAQTSGGLYPAGKIQLCMMMMNIKKEI